jgi:hypothetical protein
VAAALLAEHRECRRDAVQDTTHVHVDHRRPAVDVEAGDRADLADTGVAHQHIEPAELADRPRDQPFQIGPSGDVGAAHGRRAGQLRRQHINPIGAPRAEHHA